MKRIILTSFLTACGLMAQSPPTITPINYNSATVENLKKLIPVPGDYRPNLQLFISEVPGAVLPDGYRITITYLDILGGRTITEDLPAGQYGLTFKLYWIDAIAIANVTVTPYRVSQSLSVRY